MKSYNKFVEPYTRPHKDKYGQQKYGSFYEEIGDNFQPLYEETKRNYTYFTYNEQGYMKNAHLFRKSNNTLDSQLNLEYDKANNVIGRISLIGNSVNIHRKIFNKDKICIRHIHYRYWNQENTKHIIERTMKLKLDDKANIIFIREYDKIERINTRYHAKFSEKNIIEYSDKLGNHWNQNYGHELHQSYAVIKDKELEYI